ncbi:flagellar biosynthesis protein FlhB [Paraneptunicella aestuarii]|uniref:flagellar biosynthesis protein FlhB n=1 Tax=Paraneptunicella aestuarii TaxID=2831148 RepID=UPI001E341110|nr:flagellar biosynthesis protein FlhB [Paraneptunicella aestuarii]UAA38156.1 flagellar biosynthesis protein FlhB [Paraneptunicella aestuarii]
MADTHDKTEEPTSKRLEDARNKGQIARSRELSTALVLLFSAITLFILGRDIGIAMYRIMERMFTLSKDETYDYNHMFQAWGYAFSEIAIPVISYLLIVAIAGFYGSIALGGYNWSWQSAQPKMSKLNPINGLKRMFGPNGLVELLKAIAKFVIVACITYMVLSFFQDEALHLDMELYPRNIYHALELIGWSFIIICCAMLPIAAFDAPYQKYKHHEEMKMTKQEVKDERKNAEGDPLVKSRIRRLQFQAAARRMMQEVPKADVIVTNPTHYSVAIKYEDNGNRAPVVVAKGVDELAMHIRKIADAHQVPIIQSPMLARSIYYTTEVDEEIPEKLFMAVAQVLAYVFQLKKFKKGRGRRPKPLSKDLPIPPELRH